MRIRTTAIPAAMATVVCLTLLQATPVAAHDVHTFGRVTVALGWLHEPAYVGVDNAVQVLVKDASGKAITDISDKDLTVEVSLGNAKLGAQPLQPTADPDTGLGTPGEYEMHFIPTAPGAYTFHVRGTVSGQAVDDSVTAGPSTFDEVRDPAAVEFPNKVPALSDLSTKVDRNTARIESLRSDSGAAASAAQDRADTALVVGIVALVLGLLAGGAAGALVARARRRPAA